MAFVKALPNRTFDGKSMLWKVPHTKEVEDKLRAHGFKIIGLDKTKTYNFPKTDYRSQYMPVPIDETLFPTLRAYQIECVKFLEWRKGNALIADQMGCVCGTMPITIKDSTGEIRRISLEQAYHYQFLQPFKIRSMNETKFCFTFNSFNRIVCSGTKETVLVVTKKGYRVRLTADHEVRTFKGWEPIGSLNDGLPLHYIAINAEIRINIVVWDEIVSITPDGKSECYDIIMRNPHRNFVAYGVVVHNCGKTAESLSYVKLHPEKRPVLIVVNAPIKKQWEREYPRWVFKEDIKILYGKTPVLTDSYPVYIINYDILDAWKQILIDEHIQIVIADEITALSKSSSKRSKAMRAIVKKTRADFIAMSGTPIKKRPAQFFTVLNMIDPISFPDEWKFLNRYCKPRHNGFSLVYDGCSNVEELYSKVQPLMIRRTKEDVLKELPVRTRTVVPLSIETKYMEDWQDILNPGMGARELRERVESLKNSAYKYKEASCIEWIKNKLEEVEKLVVFAYHTSVVDSLHLAFRQQSRKIYGSTSLSDRDFYIQEFINSDKVNLLVMNIVSGGVGIDGLQKVCDTTAFVEFAWSAADHDQAESRLHRMGQQNPVDIFYLIGPDTIDEHLMEIVDESIKNFSLVIEGKQAGEDDLLLKLKEKAK